MASEAQAVRKHIIPPGSFYSKGLALASHQQGDAFCFACHIFCVSAYKTNRSEVDGFSLH